MDMMKKSPMHMVTYLLLVIGGLNWLLYGLFRVDVGAWIGGMDSPQARVVYVLVGLSALYELMMHKKWCKMCDMMMSKPASGPSSGASTGGGMNMGQKM